MTIFGLELFSGAKGADRSTSIVIAATDHSDERRWNHVKRLWELPRRPTLTRTSVGRWVAPYRNASDHKWQTPHVIFVPPIPLCVLCLLPKASSLGVAAVFLINSNGLPDRVPMLPAQHRGESTWRGPLRRRWSPSAVRGG